MSERHEVYGHIENETDLHHVFKKIREDVDAVDSRASLTELYRRAGYLITLTYAPSWIEKFGHEAERLRDIGQEEFRVTAHRINRRAKQIGTEADYEESWGHR